MRATLEGYSVLRTGLLAVGLVVAAPQVSGTGAPRATASAATVSTPADSLRDPALRTGNLPNGLRYYVRANATPARRAELRLIVNAGSLQEDDDQQGFAHFLEHMAFNGTRHFPRHALIDFVENAGMEFGADLNAYTSYDETVYTLTVPTDDSSSLRQGLQILEDWAGGGILIDSAEVVAERGVVMGEWRSRLADTASQRIQARVDTAMFGDTRYLNRRPIGLPKLLETAEPAPIRRFYEDWYRPDLMAVVVVGDIDPAAVEAEIRRRFGSIAAADSARPRPSESLRIGREPAVHILRDNVIPRVELFWTLPPEPARVEDAARQKLVRTLLVQGLQQTLLRMGEQPSRPFVHAALSQGRLVRPLDVVAIEMITWPDSLDRGLAAILSELERVAQHGVPAPVLARQKAALLRQLEGAVASAAARSSKVYAAQYVDHYLTGEGLLASAEQELAMARRLLPAITPEVLAQAARFWREAPERRALVYQSQFAHVRPPTREGIIALFDSIVTTKLPAVTPATVPDDTPLLAREPKPGKVTTEVRHAGVGIVEWRLSNGARVLFRSSPHDPDEVLLRAWSPGGFSLVPDTLFFSTGRMVAHMMTEAAGLGRRDRQDLLRELATTGLRDFRVHIGYAEESIDLAGSPRELELLFQLLHLQFTAPKLDTAALASWRSYAKYQPRGFSIHDQLNQAFARGEPRLLPVQTHLAELANIDKAMAVYRDRFGNAGDFTFIITGAATTKQVKPLVERYLASLPATAAREQPTAPKVRPFLNRVRQTVSTLELPKAQTLLVFDGEFPAEPAAYLAERERLGAVRGVLTRRLRDRLREELGATYGVFVEDLTYALPRERYRVLIGFDAAPDRMRDLNWELLAVVDSVRATGATPAELTRVATIQRRQLETRLQSNRYWLERTGLFARLGIPLDRIATPYGEAPLTPGELQAAAQRYLPSDVYIQMTAMPRDSTLWTGVDSTTKTSAQLTTRWW